MRLHPSSRPLLQELLLLLRRCRPSRPRLPAWQARQQQQQERPSPHSVCLQQGHPSRRPLLPGWRLLLVLLLVCWERPSRRWPRRRALLLQRCCPSPLLLRRAAMAGCPIPLLQLLLGYR